MEEGAICTRFDYEAVLKRLNELNSDTGKIGIQDLHDLCKDFTKLSGSLGSLISWGFKGISFQNKFG